MKSEEKDISSAERVGAEDLDPKLLRLIEVLDGRAERRMELLLRRLLPAPAPRKRPQSPERAEVHRLINDHCNTGTRERFDDAGRRCHLAYDGGKTLAEAKAMRPRVSGFDLLEERGQLADFLAVARRELPKGPTLQFAAAPPPAPAEHPASPAESPLAAAMRGQDLGPGDMAVRTGLSEGTIRQAMKGTVPGKHTRRRIAQVLRREATDLWPRSSRDVAGQQ